jgi:glycosyltransferase involved in cell wall biosynthesis
MLVVPSLWQEAMGRVVLEAFAYGIPVAGANRGGIPELIGPDRGWIFDPDRTGELEKLLRDCADRPGQLAGMRSAARAASSRFSHDAMLAGYLEAYRDAMQRSAAAPGPA